MTTVRMIKTPLGWMRVEANERGVTQVKFISKKEKEIEGSKQAMHHAELAAQEMNEYFSGKRTHFSVPLDTLGTPFQKKIWKTLSKIKAGEVLSYGELARKAHYPRAARAVGSAMRTNPVCVLIPCHRVVPTGKKSIGNYNGGVKKKEWLLNHEKRQSENH